MPAGTWLPKTIRGGFALFALSLALPLIALIGYGLYDRARDEFAAAEILALRLAESNADRTGEYLSGLRATLEALARRPLVRAMDAARCDPRLGDLVELYPRAASLIVVDVGGAILCSSNPLPRDRVVRVRDMELLTEMRADPRFRVSKPVRNRFDGRWIVSAVQPVTDEKGSLVGTVAMATDLLRWHPFPPPSALPAGAILTIATSDGTIIARSADEDKWISRKLWDERLMQRVLGLKEGVVHATGADGVEKVFGVSSVRGLPWVVLAGLPEESVFAPARARLAETGATLALVIGGVLVLAWAFVARLAKPIRAIAAAVRARSEGNEAAEIPVAGPIEVAEVARELNRLIETTERALAESGKQSERLRIVHEIDRAITSEVKPDAIAAAVLQPVRLLLGVARVNINLVGDAAGDVEWFASAGRHRTHVGSGLRFPAYLIGDVNALKRGEPQKIDTRAQLPSKERDALIASGVHYYMAVPMITGGELIGAVSFGGELDWFPEEQVTIAREVATQLAVAIGNARLYQRVQRLNAELEQRVRERTSALEAANKELESFSYSVSHDLRAPLRAVDGYALMLAEDYGDRLDDEGRRLLKVVRASAERMGQLIDDLLRFSQIGRRPLALATLDMRALAGEVVAEATQLNPLASIELGALPEVTGDRALLRQVWANLVGNAIKYSARAASPRVEISGHSNERESIYTVRDNGAGFDMRYYEKLFNVFQRLHGEDEFPGTGVGLAIVQRVVARHGGRVWGEGAIGKGASFHFALPRES